MLAEHALAGVWIGDPVCLWENKNDCVVVPEFDLYIHVVFSVKVFVYFEAVLYCQHDQ